MKAVTRKYLRNDCSCSSAHYTCKTYEQILTKLIRCRTRESQSLLLQGSAKTVARTLNLDCDTDANRHLEPSFSC